MSSAGHPSSVMFVVPVRAVGKARPRVTFLHGRARAYTPKKTHEFEQQVAAAARQHFAVPSELACRVRVLSVFEPPKSWSKTKRAAAINGRLPYLNRPDTDNIEKAVLDALVGVAYVDDRLVCGASSHKRYGERDEVRVVIRFVPGVSE